MSNLCEVILLLLRNTSSKTLGSDMPIDSGDDAEYCLSWRLAVEANNAGAWRTVPPRCVPHVETYMLRGQYDRDLDMVVGQTISYMSSIVRSSNGQDVWILDVDDSCVSNLPYYKGKAFGGDPFDPVAFSNWVKRGICPAIPATLRLYKTLIENGFKVFLLTGRSEEVLGKTTAENLCKQGFVGHERLIMRSTADRGKSAVVFKSAVRKQLVAEGYKIRGNVGDQWSDLVGDFAGDRAFKLPNAMYFVS